MATFNLSRTRKNAILSSITEIGLTPGDFTWIDTPSSVVDVGPGQPPWTVELLRHEPTGYWFSFDVNEQGSLWAIFEPGPEGSRYVTHAGGWVNVYGYVEQWLRAVKDEHDAADLWAELGQQGDLMVGEAVENTPFTPEEQEQIAGQLTEAKEYARANFQLERAQLDRIEAQLDYLVEAAQRVGRIDWRNLLVGSFISLILGAVLPVAPVQQLLFIVLRGLAHMFGGGASELSGPPPELT